jgi:hypothetical protein
MSEAGGSAEHGLSGELSPEVAPREYTVASGQWQELPDAVEDDRMVINMGPQHPSTHGVLRMVLTLDGETVISNRTRSSATCTPASRRTPSTGPGSRA